MAPLGLLRKYSPLMLSRVYSPLGLPSLSASHCPLRQLVTSSTILSNLAAEITFLVCLTTAPKSRLCETFITTVLRVAASAQKRCAASLNVVSDFDNDGGTRQAGTDADNGDGGNDDDDDNEGAVNDDDDDDDDDDDKTKDDVDLLLILSPSVLDSIMELPCEPPVSLPASPSSTALI